MNQKQINQQYLRIAQAVNKAYISVETGAITEKVFNSKLAAAMQARRTLANDQYKLDHRT